MGVDKSELCSQNVSPLILILNMNSTLSTPSVDFHFLDAPNTQRESPPPLEQSELSYGLSPTVEKTDHRCQQTTVAHHVDSIPRPLIKNSFYYDSQDSQDFFNNFQSKFKITLSQSQRSFGTALSHQTHTNSKIKIDEPEEQQIHAQIFNKISLSNRIVDQDRYKENNSQLSQAIDQKIRQNCQNFKKKKGLHPIYCFKNKISLKSKLIILPSLQHAQSERITKKTNYNSYDVPLIQDTNSFKGFDYNLARTSKVTPRENNAALRIYEKGQRKKVLSLKLNDIFRKSNQKLPSIMSVQGKNKPVLSLRQKKQLKKSNIFLKLPLVH